MWSDAVVAASSVFEQAPLILCGIEGTDLTFVASNAAHRAAIGRSMLGQPLHEAFPDLIGQRVYEMLDAVRRTGEPHAATEWRMQFRNPDDPADEQVTELYLDFVVSPWRADDGTLRGVIVHGLDATGRVREKHAAQASAAETQRHLTAARDTLAELQRHLLPSALPVLPGVQLAATYLLAESDTTAGGDWFDAVVLGDGRVALVVGDVVGHGVAASATMGHLRAMLRMALRTADGDAAAALLSVGDALADLPDAYAATVCVAVLDPATGRLEYCTAGHPPPLVITGDGTTRLLDATGGAPVGTRRAGGEPNGLGVFPTATTEIGPGDVVLLYTDGILERPGRDLDTAAAELARTAADSVTGRVFEQPGLTTADRTCAQTLEVLVRASGHTDDITLLAAHRVPGVAPLRLDLVADPAAVPTARQAVTAWAAEHGAGPADIEAVEHAIGEIVTNAAEHAYLDTARGPMRVTADLTPLGDATITVTDHGRWRAPHRPNPLDPLAAGSAPDLDHRGLGLIIATKLLDHLHIGQPDRHPDAEPETQPHTSGTTVTARRRMTTPARLLTADDLHAANGRPATATDVPSLLLVVDQPHASGHRIRVDGTIDTTTAEQFGLELTRRTSGGVAPLVVDLTGVTHLASAGVAELHRATARNAAHDQPLVLYAASNSTAHRILDLVALPHTTTDPWAAEHEPGVDPRD